MRRVVVDMQNKLFADAIARALQEESVEFQVYQSEKPTETAEICLCARARILLMEVTSYMPWKLEERLRIRNIVKRECPDCKIVLVVDENTEKALANRVLQAKKDGIIDNFVYGSVSAAYLSAVLDVL